MQHVGISVVKNEADIIEVFVRHNLQYLNKLYIVEHNCQDNTPEILNHLKAEGHNIEIYTNRSSRHIQAEEFNHLIRKIDGDFVSFLDADEFIISPDYQSSMANLPEDTVSFINWHNYMPQPTDDASELNPLKRIHYMLSPVDTNQHKAIIPRSIYSRPDSYVLLGGHEIYYKNEEIVPAPYRLISSIYLAHLPIRSLNQIKVKSFTNWLSKLADPLHKSGKLQDGKIPTWHHWKVLYDIFKNDPNITEAQAVEAVTEAYMKYSKLKGELKLVDEPIETGSKIIYPIKELTPLLALATAAEQQVAMLQKTNAFIIGIIKELKELDELHLLKSLE